METKDIEAKPPSPWIPEGDAINLALLGKLAEELNEAGSATARCIIQGIMESEPVTGKLNKDWLEDELADVLALVGLARHRFGLDFERMQARSEKKGAYLIEWFKMLGTPVDDPNP